jgi:hypothetical protein
MERYLRVNLLGLGPSSYKQTVYRAAVSQRLGNTAIDYSMCVFIYFNMLKVNERTVWQSGDGRIAYSQSGSRLKNS